MSDNPFHDAVNDPGPPPGTRTVVSERPFFHQAIEAEKLRQQARNMTRQELFNNGFLTVQDMDDEELRAGRMRDINGKIPGATKTLGDVPRDLYDAMVQEHLLRTNEKFRQNLDVAQNVLLDIMQDDSCEPKDRMESAKYYIERVMGKPQERVAVTVNKAPWEELMGDVAKITRQEHLARKAGAIDAEVVEAPDDSSARVSPTRPVQNTEPGVAEPAAWQTVLHDVGQGGTPPVHGDDHQASSQPQDVPNSVGVGGNSPASVVGPGSDVAGHRTEHGAPVPEHDSRTTLDETRLAPTPFTPPIPTPTHDNPASNNPLSQQIRTAQEEAVRVAEARAARKKLIQAAKKRRIVMRTVGADQLKRNIADEAFAVAQENLLKALRDTGEPEPSAEAP